MTQHSPFDRFTERAKKSLVLAQEEAQKFGHGYLGTEHLLLGLVSEGDGIAAKVLAKHGVTFSRLRGVVTQVIGRGEHLVAGDVALAPETKRAIDCALEEARMLRHNYIGTEHLLLGLTREQPPPPAKTRGRGPRGRPLVMRYPPRVFGTYPLALEILTRAKLDIGRLRADVLTIVGQVASAQTAEAGEGTQRAGETRDNVVTCRVSDRTLNALDALVEAGVHSTRSEAAARLIDAGLAANRGLMEKVHTTVVEIRRLREQTQELARQWAAEEAEGEPEQE